MEVVESLKLLTYQQAADELRISVYQLKQLLSSGLVVPVKLNTNGRRYVQYESLINLREKLQESLQLPAGGQVTEKNYLNIGYAIFHFRCGYIKKYMTNEDYKDIRQIIELTWLLIAKPAEKKTFIRAIKKELYNFGKALGIHTRNGGKCKD